MEDNDIRRRVAEGIRAVAEEIMRNADDYAVGMDNATNMEIRITFELSSMPKIIVEKTMIPIDAIRSKRCAVWNQRG